MATATQYQSYYTKSKPIVGYMTKMLNLQDTDTVFEPCGGDGVFVDELLRINPNANINVFELNPDAVNTLRFKYNGLANVTVKETDTLLDASIINRRSSFEKIVGNPPYGARNSDKKKEELSKIYPVLYTKESYTLFLYACLRCLKNEGILSFIIPDTFLTLHRHIEIRKYLLQFTRIKEIALFSSSFFPGVNFGYSNLCIITVQKSNDIVSNLSNSFVLRTGFNKITDLEDYTSSINRQYRQEDIFSNANCAFHFNFGERIYELNNDPFTTKIGDIADCVTGFYSGNDKVYLHPISKEQKMLTSISLQM